MFNFNLKKQYSKPFKGVVLGVLVSFMTLTILPPHACAQIGLGLPTPGVMVAPSQAFVPTILKGLKVYPENPFQFDFIVDTGHAQLEGQGLEQESKKLIKYFLSSLTTPEEDVWVNLSPFEQDRIIADGFEDTEMGRDLLAQDYLLKQLTASLMYPEGEIGKKFWKTIKEKAFEKYGVTDVPVNTFNKVWITPESATVYEKGDKVFITQSHLKVMLEEDYLALSESQRDDPKVAWLSGDVGIQVIKEIIIPEIEKEINEGENFAQLRQIYHALILSMWFKQKLKQSVLGQIYVDQNKTKGTIEVEDKEISQTIYQKYIEAYKKGAYNYIKEDYDPRADELVPKKYFSGGFVVGDFALTAQPIVAVPSITPIGDFAQITANAVLPEAAMSDQAITNFTKYQTRYDAEYEAFLRDREGIPYGRDVVDQFADDIMRRAGRKGAGKGVFVLAIDGNQGALKTTTTDHIVARLREQGRSVVVIKRDWFLTSPIQRREIHQADLDERDITDNEYDDDPERPKIFRPKKFENEVLKRLVLFNRQRGQGELVLNLRDLYKREAGPHTDQEENLTVQRSTVVIIEGINLLKEEWIEFYDATLLMLVKPSISLERRIGRNPPADVNQLGNIHWRINVPSFMKYLQTGLIAPEKIIVTDELALDRAMFGENDGPNRPSKDVVVNSTQITTSAVLQETADAAMTFQRGFRHTYKDRQVHLRGILPEPRIIRNYIQLLRRNRSQGKSIPDVLRVYVSRSISKLDMAGALNGGTGYILREKGEDLLPRETLDLLEAARSEGLFELVEVRAEEDFLGVARDLGLHESIVDTVFSKTALLVFMSEWIDGQNITEYIIEKGSDEEALRRMGYLLGQRLAALHRNRFIIGDTHFKQFVIQRDEQRVLRVDFENIFTVEEALMKARNIEGEYQKLYHDLGEISPIVQEAFRLGYISDRAMNAQTDAANLATEIVQNVKLASMDPGSIEREFRQLIASGAEIKAVGRSREDPVGLLLDDGYAPKYKIELFDTVYYLTDAYVIDGIRILIGYVVQEPQDGRTIIYPRVFYKDDSINWRSISHYYGVGNKVFWLGKGRVKGSGKKTHHMEETTNVPFEIEPSLDAINSYATTPQEDSLAIPLMVRNVGGVNEDGTYPGAYEDFTGPKEAVEAVKENLVNDGEPILYFEDEGVPTSLKFASGYEPDYAKGIIEITTTSSVLYEGPVTKYRILSRNREVQYQFVVAPNQIWVNPPQALTTEITSYGVRSLDIPVHRYFFLPGVEYHELKGFVMRSQIPIHYAGAQSRIDPRKAYTTPWTSQMPVIQDFKKNVLDKKVKEPNFEDAAALGRELNFSAPPRPGQALFPHEIARLRAKRPDFNWQNASEVLFQELEKEQDDGGAFTRSLMYNTPENRENYYANSTGLRRHFLLFLERLIDGEDIDLEAFRDVFLDLHGILLIGVDGQTYYFPPSTQNRHDLPEQPNIDWHLEAAQRFSPFLQPDERDERLIEILRNMQRFVTEDLDANETLEAIGNIYYYGFPGQYLFDSGNISFVMGMVNGMLRLGNFNWLLTREWHDGAWYPGSPEDAHQYLRDRMMPRGDVAMTSQTQLTGLSRIEELLLEWRSKKAIPFEQWAVENGVLVRYDTRIISRPILNLDSTINLGIFNSEELKALRRVIQGSFAEMLRRHISNDPHVVPKAALPLRRSNVLINSILHGTTPPLDAAMTTQTDAAALSWREKFEILERFMDWGQEEGEFIAETIFLSFLEEIEGELLRLKAEYASEDPEDPWQMLAGFSKTETSPYDYPFQSEVYGSELLRAISSGQLSSMFRYPKIFNGISEEVFPRYVEEAVARFQTVGEPQTIHVGVAGSAYGQTPLSLLILLDRAIKQGLKGDGLQTVQGKIHIFSLGDRVWRKLRSNKVVYPEAMLRWLVEQGKLSEEEVRKYFTPTPDRQGFVRSDYADQRFVFYGEDGVNLEKPETFVVPDERMHLLVFLDVLQHVHVYSKSGLPFPPAPDVLKQRTREKAVEISRTFDYIESLVGPGGTVAISFEGHTDSRLLEEDMNGRFYNDTKYKDLGGGWRGRFHDTRRLFVLSDANMFRKKDQAMAAQSDVDDAIAVRGVDHFLRLLEEDLWKNTRYSRRRAREAIENMRNRSRGVFVVDDFLRNFGSSIAGGYILGINERGRDSIYNRLAKQFHLTPWLDAWVELVKKSGINFQDTTIWRFLTEMVNDASETRPIVFFVPPDIYQHPKVHATTNYTAQELTWFLKHPENMKNVFFVFGAYDPALMAPGERMEDVGGIALDGDQMDFKVEGEGMDVDFVMEPGELARLAQDFDGFEDIQIIRIRHIEHEELVAFLEVDGHK